MRLGGLVVLTPLLLASCGDGGDPPLRVDVRTDWVPVVEFAEVEVSLDDGASILVHDASFDEDFLAGVRVASLESG